MTPELAVLLLAVLAAVPAAWLATFVLAPVRMRSTSWTPADPVFTPERESALPADSRELIAGLVALGFEDRGVWRHAGGPVATGRVALLEHPRTRDAAKVLVVTAESRVAVILAFQTSFADGSEVVTANNRVLSGFSRLPDVTAAWLPDVTDPAALFRVHEQLRDALGHGQTRLPVGPDPAAFLRAGVERTHAKWLTTGYYELDEARRVLRPTWKGAVLVTWRLIWPVKPLFRARKRRATRELLARYGVSVPSEPGA
jgi:hypothetical protein